MSQGDELREEVRRLRTRLSRLSEASLRINESLNFETVLQGVLDSARALTDAAYGVATVLGDGGSVEHFLASGIDDEAARRLWSVGGGEDLWEQIGELTHPLRLADFPAQIRAWDIPDVPWPMPMSETSSFLAVPVCRFGETVGAFYLAEKHAGGEFTQEDEETLVMFAAEAALVMANARRYRDEQRARADLETLLNIAPIGVVVLDARSGAVRSVNREARRIGGDLLDHYGSVESLLGAATIARADGREIGPGYPPEEIFASAETLRAEEITVRVPGRSLSVLLNATPIRADSGDVDSYIVTVQDLASLRELERLRAEFLATASHELRTPLSSIKGSITTLRGFAADLDPGEVEQFFRIIDQQADHMRFLISDLLDVAHIETGMLRISPEPADVVSLLEAARTRFAGEAGDHDLHIDLPAELPRVMADRRRIAQVLSNLLANASAYSPAGSRIDLAAAGRGAHVEIAVRDRGAGLPAERVPELFRKFSRLDDDRPEPSGGSGLGLAICKGIVEAHGGRIWAESAGPGLGSRFAFTIPAAEEAGAPSQRTAPPPGGDQPGHERILVVDDDPEMLRYVRDVLTRDGYRPAVTGDAAQVPQLMEEWEPDLVLLDLVLPNGDGITLMRRILASRDIPVVFVSAYGRDRTIAEAFENGAEDYIVKPFSPTELVARIRAALRRRALREPEEPPVPYVRGELTVDYGRRAVTVSGRPIGLTPLEYRMLRELSLHGGTVLSHDRLSQRLWGRSRAGDLRPMRTLVRTLRRKLGDDAEAPTYIFTEPRFGYRMPAGE